MSESEVRKAFAPYTFRAKHVDRAGEVLSRPREPDEVQFIVPGGRSLQRPRMAAGDEYLKSYGPRDSASRTVANMRDPVTLLTFDAEDEDFEDPRDSKRFASAAALAAHLRAQSGRVYVSGGKGSDIHLRWCDRTGVYRAAKNSITHDFGLNVVSLFGGKDRANVLAAAEKTVVDGKSRTVSVTPR